MIKPVERSTMIGDTELTFQISRLAPKADVSILARMGDTVVLTTVVGGRDRDIGWFPLSVEYVEKLYAGGKIKGSRWVKREGKPSEEAILNARLIDRSIRPLFPKGYKNEVQVVCTILSLDGENSPDMMAAISASAALHLSSIPWAGPISTTKVAYVDADGDKTLVLNPTEDVQENSKLELVVSSTQKKVLMIETQAEELSEDIIDEGIQQAHELNTQIANFIDSLREEFGIPKQETPTQDELKAVIKIIEQTHAKEVEALLEKKASNDDDYDASFTQLIDEISDQNEDYDKKLIADAIDGRMLEILRENVLKHGKRVDGRAADEIRNLIAEVDILPRTHGSAIFQRGLTQVLSVATLGSTSLDQIIESPEGEETKGYIHHFFSPPYTYGEAGRMGWPGRREIGHGALAEKALEPVLPSREEFPYAIRVVSEVMSSNGSTSMASTCGSSLALMNAGVPIKSAVAGISIGIVFKSDDEYVLLTDIAGIEDFAGHMDFKVAGTKDGITAIQLDVKNDGLTQKMITEILKRAHTARMKVLETMNATISEPNAEVSQYAPKVVMLTPPEDKIGEIIGPGGKNIKRIIADTGAEINIDDDGKVSVSGVSKESVTSAVEAVKSVYRVVQVGESFTGEVKRILPIGAMVEYLPGREGLVHVSKLAKGFVKDPADVVSIGQEVTVKVIGVDDRGRINLGMASSD